jgi:hypothetical protein
MLKARGLQARDTIALMCWCLCIFLTFFYHSLLTPGYIFGTAIWPQHSLYIVDTLSPSFCHFNEFFSTVIFEKICKAGANISRILSCRFWCKTRGVEPGLSAHRRRPSILYFRAADQTGSVTGSGNTYFILHVNHRCCLYLQILHIKYVLC